MSSATLQGSFATPEARRRERRWQSAGLVVLALLVAAALVGLIGDRSTVVRAALVYAFLLAVFRVAGRRTLAQVTTFDLILVLVIGDATQQAIIGDDFTVIAGVLAVSTLLLLDVALGRAKHRWPAIDAIVDGLPLPLIVNGRHDREQMDSEGVSDDDVLASAREIHGVSHLDQIEHAVLEASGALSIIPKRSSSQSPSDS
jgi:uncharacterized membrane protein YcaP (DUF421 family)